MAAENTSSSNLHIVVFPWLAFGHMIPLLELSKLIAKKGHRVSFVSTPKNIQRLPKLPPDNHSIQYSSLINFVQLPLPHIDNLPETAEATADLPNHKVKYLKLAYDGLKDPFAQFLESSSPDCVLYDFVSYWVPSVAFKLNIPTGFLSPFIVSTLAFLGPSKALMGIDDDKQSWAPQLKILSHESVSGFFTHSGWSSTLEAIRCELPLILLPFLYDQGLNARVLEAKKMGYPIPRDDQTGYFTRESVAESLKLLMMEEEGKIYREKNKEMKGLLCDEAAQEGYVDNLLNYIHNLNKKIK